MFRIALYTLICLLNCQTLAASSTAEINLKPAPVIEPVIIITTKFSGERLERFLADRQISQEQLTELKEFRGDGMFRETAELILTFQALRAGGIRTPIEIKTLNLTGPRRFLQALAEGEADVMGESLWRSDIAAFGHRVRISSPLVRDGEFLVGIYTRADNLRAQSVKTLAELKQLTFVSNRNWSIDWATLKDLGVAELYSTNYYKSMLHMLRAGRADAMLSTFPPGDSLTHIDEGEGLVPIPNVRLALNGTKHLAVSGSTAHSDEVFTALEKGLAQLRAEGRITRAYRESGFYHPATANWAVINR